MDAKKEKIFQSNTTGNSIGLGGDDPLERFQVKDNDDETRYRDYKEQLVKEKQRIKRL